MLPPKLVAAKSRVTYLASNVVSRPRVWLPGNRQPPSIVQVTQHRKESSCPIAFYTQLPLATTLMACKGLQGIHIKLLEYTAVSCCAVKRTTWLAPKHSLFRGTKLDFCLYKR